ncbi:peroxisomal hydratase-dehydrogenase-epimerase [Saitoella complicata NRRL Y-17804]|nr:peroxisomal hydratase-dehydrogenase-epimerase [Saitoella complicata NRRL Y-17804]ODQ51551.1 peroxisomal hydratase-dehydrogenase-epimerase [Saitoella complicata NRRL Y-17804]
MSELRFDGKTVVVTGAGGGLGRAYAKFFGSRGANVVVNDLGVTAKGEGRNAKAADVVVEEIVKAGGKAVANYDSVDNGDRIIQTALDTYGSIHILINNAGILRDVSFRNMKDADWDLIQTVHVRGSYKCAKAAWPIFRKQKYGRIINTTSAAGLYGSFGQTNYSAAKLGLVAFSKTLAKEGAKYNINCNAIAPIAASRMTETVMPPEVLANLKPDWIVPLVAYLVHDSCSESGQVFEGGAGFLSKLRWERASGALLKTDETLTPSAVLAKWDQVTDFKNPTYPDSITDIDYVGMLESAQKLPPNAQSKEPVDFKDKVVLVTGAGGGLGRAYAVQFAKLGAKVVVNDVMDPSKTVSEIQAKGGQAAGDKHSVEDGEAVIKTCLDNFGAIHVVINNAGILRDKSFASLTDKQWDEVQAVHLRGTYKVTKAAWPHMLKQKYGRIVNTASAVGLYGNFGQANYSTAKAAILGFSKALAREGKKNNILVNCIAPNAGTAMTKTILPLELVEAFKPEYVAPFVAALSHASVPCTGYHFEVGSGWMGRVRWQRTGGVAFPVDGGLTPEMVAEAWERICVFDEKATWPDAPDEGVRAILENMSNTGGKGGASGVGASTGGDAQDEVTKKALALKGQPHHYKFDEKTLILYNLGIGAKRTDLKWTFEGSDDFEVLPTFGVIPQFGAGLSPGDFLPKFDPRMLLHGEQFLEIKKFPIPTSGELVTEPRILEVVDKGKAATVVVATTTKDAKTGEVVFENQSTTFIRGSGGFGGKSKGANRGAATAENKPPGRAPDAVVEEKTSPDQAAVYRLSGDFNPLHIDPSFASVGGFKDPILHGLCFFGFSGKHIYQKFGPYKNIKVRFAGVVYPGETLRTEMWKEGNKVIFTTKVVERNTVCISSAAVELFDPSEVKKETKQAEVKEGEVEVPGFMASKVFSTAKKQLDSASKKEKDAKLKKAAAVFQFDIKNDEGKIQSWYIDAKETGKVAAGKAPKADVTISVADKTLVDLATGKANAQKLFMSGKIKIKGNMMKAASIGDLIGGPKGKM